MVSLRVQDFQVLTFRGPPFVLSRLNVSNFSFFAKSFLKLGIQVKRKAKNRNSKNFSCFNSMYTTLKMT
ncbi:hypothetical protein E2320_013084 [Naja naja]|nr:hypothetical protein E2320_013084 [Naja naja]